MSNDVKDWAVVCIKLLQGPIIKRSEHDKLWNLLLRDRLHIDNYFSTIGVTLLVEEADGYAFDKKMKILMRILNSFQSLFAEEVSV